MEALQAPLGELLRRFRRQAGLSQADLAERANVSAAAVATLERGVRRSPHARTVEALADALGVSAAERAALRAAAAATPRSRTATPTRVADQRQPRAPLLPVWLTSFVGREVEMDALRRLLDPSGSAVRLLTLMGPGGVGKTRLAVAAAAELATAYPDGVVFVDLAPLHDARLVPATIAHSLDIRESGGRSARELLIEHLRDQQQLLVLDNFEHLLGAAPLVTELLQLCPRVTVLVTSRTVLRVQGERRFVVPTLAAPGGADHPTEKDIAGSPAVRLFVARAQAVVADFALDETNAAAVARICHHVDGLPLAIELAAARVGLLEPAALLPRLERRLASLTGGAVDLPKRQQTLRNALAWSHDLLGSGERTVFRRLAVFAGCWTLEAAEAVCADAELTADQVVECVQSLIESSLIRRLDGRRGQPSFGMLETVREYADERLRLEEDDGVVRRRHYDYCLALAESLQARLHGPDQAAVADELELEHDNFRTALEFWSLDKNGQSGG